MATTLDTRLPYRIGSRTLPVLPVNTLQIANLAEKIPDISNQLRIIRRILGEHKITEGRLDVAYRLHADTSPSDECITILIVATFRRNCQEAWIAAVQKISSALSKVGIEYAVELIDHSAFRGQATWPFLNDVYGWNQTLSSRILSLVEDRQWITIDMVYREDIEGRQAGDKTPRRRPTILFCARDADQSYWRDNAVSTFLQSIGLGEINVETCYLHQLGYASTLPNERQLSKAYRNKIRMGHSCGKLGSDRSGTIGGAINLEKNGKLVNMAITNRHVLLENSINNGLSVLEPKEDIQVECPSEFDHGIRLKNLENDISDEEHIIGNPDEYTVDDYENAVDALRSLQSDKTRLRKFNRNIGKVFAASGGSGQYGGDQTDNWALDWCLVQLNPQKSFELFTTGDPLHGKYNVSQYCSIRDDQAYQVFKCGRSSGFTRGFISATRAIIRSVIEEAEDGMTVQSVQLEGRSEPLSCFTLIPKYHKDPEEFIRPGDYGSLILLDPADFRPAQLDNHKAFKDDQAPHDLDINDWTPPWEEDVAVGTPMTDNPEMSKDREPKAHGQKEALVAGLAFAGNRDCLISYMMPMDLIVQDIESVTGGIVVNPRFGGKIGKEKTDVTKTE